MHVNSKRLINRELPCHLYTCIYMLPPYLHIP